MAALNFLCMRMNMLLPSHPPHSVVEGTQPNVETTDARAARASRAFNAMLTINNVVKRHRLGADVD